MCNYSLAKEAPRQGTVQHLREPGDAMTYVHVLSEAWPRAESAVSTFQKGLQEAGKSHQLLLAPGQAES